MSCWKKNHYNFQHKRYKVNITAFVCNRPARQFLRSIKSHNACYSCEGCLVYGRWQVRVVFDKTNCSLRTNQSFINQGCHDHQIGNTHLIDSGIDCIMQFPLDYMHLVCLSVMKRVLLFWKESPRLFRLAPFQINQISERLKNMTGLMPSEFARQPRGLDELRRWKATELRAFLLYVRTNCLERYSETRKIYTFFSLSQQTFVGLEDVLNTSWKTENCYTEDVFKTSSTHVFKASSLRHAFKTSLRRLGDKKWGYLYLTNLKGYVSNKSIFHRSLIIMYKIINKNPVISIFVLLWNSSSFSILRIKISDDCWCCEISWIQIRHCRTGEVIKTKF